jgi:fucose permease
MVKFNSGYALYGIALCFTGLNLFIQVLPISTADYLIAHLSLNNTQVINISSIFLICYAIMQIPGGLIFDKFGLKIILPLGLLLTTLGSR